MNTKTLLIAAVTLFFACSPCKPTQNGIVFIGLYPSYPEGKYPAGGKYPAAWTCEIIQSIETTMVAELPQYNPKRLEGWELGLAERNIPTDPWGRKVAGYTLCPTKTMVVWDTDYPKLSSFAHELGHALQYCESKKPVDEGLDEDHSDWHREGIFQAIDKVQGERSGP